MHITTVKTDRHSNLHPGAFIVHKGMFTGDFSFSATGFVVTKTAEKTPEYNKVFIMGTRNHKLGINQY